MEVAPSRIYSLLLVTLLCGEAERGAVLLHAAPVVGPDTNANSIDEGGEDKPVSISKETVDYLSQFGYIQQSETEALRTEQEVRDAIRNLQFMGRLNATGVLDGATRELMRRPRCGVPDVTQQGFRNKRRVKRYNLQGQRWSRTNLTWSLRKGPSSTAGISVDAVRRELHMALQLWQRHSRLAFSEVLDGEGGGPADLEIFFHRQYHGDGYPFDGSGSVLAHAFFPGSGRGGDVHLDDDEAWSEERLVTRHVTSVYAVAVHEFGHALGLSHSSVEGSLMFPWYAGAPDDFVLPEDDRKAIQILYGAPWEKFELPKHKAKGQDPNEGKGSPGGNADENSVDADEGSGTGPDHKLPDKCATDFDAVAVIRSEMWVFKGRYFWRIDKNGGSRGDPIELSAFWYGLPDDVDHVDAVYERPDHKIIFFVGRNYYILTGNSQLEAGPIPVTRLGLPSTLEKVDGAMRWGWNEKTYFFAETMYWRFDEDIQQVELDYPRDISVWKGVPYNLDAAFQNTDGKTYFFKGRDFWEFDDVRMRVRATQPTAINSHWMHCPKEIKDPFKSSLAVSSASVCGTSAAVASVVLLAIYLTLPRNTQLFHTL